MFSHYYTEGMFWFRLFGVGFSCKDVRLHPMLFSERNGYTRFVKLGNYLIKYLPRSL